MTAYEAPEVEMVNFEFEGTIAATGCEGFSEGILDCSTNDMS